MDIFIITVISYLIGSVPFAYVIGRFFYQTDIREHGSGNLGGTNAGRVLGKKAGISVMVLDVLKVTLSVFIAMEISSSSWAVASGAVSAAIGHCYPIYVNFRGGKAVAALFGFLLALWIYAGYSSFTFFLPLLVFLTVLSFSKIVSLSSILASVFNVINVSLFGMPLPVVISAVVFSILIILRHHENIRRLISGTERKITWIR